MKGPAQEDALSAADALRQSSGAPRAHRKPRWRTAFLLGVFVEILGVANSHAPVFWLVNHGHSLDVPDGLLVILLLGGGAAMAALWGSVIYGVWALIDSARSRLAPRQERLALWAAALLCAVGLVSMLRNIALDKPTAYAPTQPARAVVSANNALGVDLYHEFRRTPGNVFFSPYSIITGLGMVRAGAAGQTASEIDRTAHFTIPASQVHTAFHELSERIQALRWGRRLILQSANGLWVQKDYDFRREYLDLVSRDYTAEINGTDFRSADAMSEINRWIERRTKGAIKPSSAVGRPDSAARLVLCNVIYFKGNWRSAFDSSKTAPAPFHLSRANTVSVPMMHQKGEFKTAWVQWDYPPIQLLELPYFGGDLSMVILLPSATDGLTEMENIISAESLQEWLGLLDKATARDTVVQLPRFVVRQSIDLIPRLRSLGMTSAFDERCDLAGWLIPESDIELVMNARTLLEGGIGGVKRK